MLSQLLERELDKCLRLVVAIPMDMSSFYGKYQNDINVHQSIQYENLTSVYRDVPDVVRNSGLLKVIKFQLLIR